MIFLNPWLLLALAGVSIPVIIHLIRRQAAKPVAWGAMRFLMDTLSERRRRIEWEDLLLMAARCLLVGLAALAVARPFVPPDASAAWSFVLPVALAGLGMFGGSFVLGSVGKRRWCRAAALATVGLAAGLVAMEHRLNLRRFETSGRREVAIILDTSASMTRRSPGGSLFDAALTEARQLITEAPRGTSFVVVLGGPAPQALSATPVSHRADVLAQLAGLQPSGGTFRAHEALGVATLALAAGERPNKEIIVLTDAQRHGWRFENTSAWQSLEKAWQALPPPRPRLLLRRLPLPATTRNAGLASLTTTRALTGTDRPATLRATVENTGTEALTAGSLTLEIDGQPAGREALGLLAAGQTATVEFRHRFTTPGPHVAVARLTGSDDLPGDDHAELVVVARKSLAVLVVDGNPAGDFFQRAAGHTALALAPAASLLRGQAPDGGFLMNPTVVPAPELTKDHLAAAEVVILADVARLPALLASALADQVAAGGGLLVLAGPRADPAFYNAWNGIDGRLLPLQLGAESTSAAGVSPAPATCRHEALAWAADERRSDLGGAVIRRWRKAELTPVHGALAAAFGNGDPFLATRSYGYGRSVTAACAFDARAGNLPARTAFVPLIHELVTWAAGSDVEWNTAAAWSPVVALDGRASGGLTATFRRLEQPGGKVLLEQTVPAIDFNWAEDPPARGLPRDRFSVTWTGRLLPPISGTYLIEAEVDDRLTVALGGKDVLSASREHSPAAGVRLEAGKPLPVEARYEEDGGLASVRLLWTPPGGVRQVIPPSAWLPPGDGPLARLTALDPQGKPRQATVLGGRRGRELRIEGVAGPGLYQVSLPPELAATVPPLAGARELPVVVRGDIAESRTDLIAGDDLAQLRARIDTLLPASAGDVLAVLSGRGFGREITRLIAVAAVLLLVVETALGRWVSRSRKIGDDLRVNFADDTPPLDRKGGRR